jgi:hypothetical protein
MQLFNSQSPSSNYYIHYFQLSKATLEAAVCQRVYPPKLSLDVLDHRLGQTFEKATVGCVT